MNPFEIELRIRLNNIIKFEGALSNQNEIRELMREAIVLATKASYFHHYYILTVLDSPNFNIVLCDNISFRKIIGGISPANAFYLISPIKERNHLYYKAEGAIFLVAEGRPERLVSAVSHEFIHAYMRLSHFPVGKGLSYKDDLVSPSFPPTKESISAFYAAVRKGDERLVILMDYYLKNRASFKAQYPELNAQLRESFNRYYPRITPITEDDCNSPDVSNILAKIKAKNGGDPPGIFAEGEVYSVGSVLPTTKNRCELWGIWGLENCTDCAEDSEGEIYFIRSMIRDTGKRIEMRAEHIAEIYPPRQIPGETLAYVMELNGIVRFYPELLLHIAEDSQRNSEHSQLPVHESMKSIVTKSQSMRDCLMTVTESVQRGPFDIQGKMYSAVLGLFSLSTVLSPFVSNPCLSLNMDKIPQIDTFSEKGLEEAGGELEHSLGTTITVGIGLAVCAGLMTYGFFRCFSKEPSATPLQAGHAGNTVPRQSRSKRR